MNTITSTSNSHIKQIRKLQERKERQKSGLFYAEGIRIVAEAVQQNAAIETLVVAPELLNSSFCQQIIEAARSKGVSILEVSSDIFKSIAMKEGPQGIAAVIRQQWAELETSQTYSSWVALDAVQNPGNLGTILRTHDAVGGSGLILLDQSTDPYDPAAIRASMGAIFTQKLARMSFEAFSQWKQNAQVTVIGTSGAASQDYQAIDYPASMTLLMGSERLGLQEHHLALCDNIVRIPMIGRSDSLNLSVATAVVLYEIFNQHRKKGLVAA